MTHILKSAVFETSPGSTRRITYFAHAFVFFSLVALLLVPFTIFQRTEALRKDVRHTAGPAQLLIDDFEIALARQVSAVRGWLLTDDEAFRSFFYTAKTEADEALAALAPLVEQLGPASQFALRELVKAEMEWLAPNLEVLSGQMAQADLERQIPTQQQRYLSTIEAAKQLNQAVTTVADERREAIRNATVLSMVITAVLSVFALLSMAIILWNVYRWRTLAAHLQKLVDELGEQAARARAAVRTRDEVLAIVSHDLRTPLTAIELSAANLRSHVATAFHRRHLDIIGRSVERTNRLISDILDVTRIEAGRKLSIEPRFIEIEPLLNSVVETFRPQTEERLQELECVVAPDLPPLFADRDRLLQVLSNLVGNAVKFTPDGGRICIYVYDSGDRVEFAVSDTGPGIAESDIEHIFDPYWQVQRTARLGTGLGLTIAKGIVDGHGGQLQVESTPGEGTTFTFTIPRTTCTKVDIAAV